jgi:hypothetical protein
MVSFSRFELFRKNSGVVRRARHGSPVSGIAAAFVRRVMPRDVSKVLFARANGLGRLSTMTSLELLSPCFREGTAFDSMIVGILCVSYGIKI